MLIIKFLLQNEPEKSCLNGDGEKSFGDLESRCQFHQHKAFTRADPKSIKIQLGHQYIFALLGSVCGKALCKMLMKLTQGKVDIS
jgi:hypothetical protein